jgi:hypothetical protein
VTRWWSQKRRLHQIRAAVPTDASPSPRRPRDYRRADWPRCPQCGDDELMSTAPIVSGRQPQPTDPMRCLACGWSGEVLTQ